MKTFASFAAAVAFGCVVASAAAPAHAASKADSGSAYASRYFDFSIGLFAAEGIMTHKRIWAPAADVPSLRTPINAFLVPSFALVRGLRFELGLGLLSMEPPLTFAIEPGLKLFPFHKYTWKSPMTKRKGGKWVPPPPIDGPFVRVAGIIELGSIGVKDKDDLDGDFNCPPADTGCPRLDMMGNPIVEPGRRDKARAPFIIGGAIGLGWFFRGKGEKPEAPEAPEGAPEAPAAPALGGGDGITDWVEAPGDIPAPAPPTMPEMPKPPEIKEPKPPEAPKPAAVGFNIEVVTSLLKHGKLLMVPDPYRGRFDAVMNHTGCIDGTEATGGGPLGGTGPNFIADCEQNTLELRFELRVGVEMWLF
jgi:hypothetical protein